MYKALEAAITKSGTTVEVVALDKDRSPHEFKAANLHALTRTLLANIGNCIPINTLVMVTLRVHYRFCGIALLVDMPIATALNNSCHMHTERELIH